MALGNRRPRIGLIINHLEGPFLEPLWQEMARQAKALEFDLFMFEGKFLDSRIRLARQHNIIYQLAATQFLDGFVVSAGTMTYGSGLQALLDFLKPFGNRPLVNVGQRIPGYASVTVDSFASEVALVMHLLLDHQRRNLIYVGGPDDHDDNMERYRAYLEAHRLAGVEARLDRVVHAGYREEDGYRGTMELFEKAKALGETFDGVVYGNDVCAAGGIEALRELGISIPMECSVVGFDNQDIAMTTLPPLTTVHLPMDEMAKAAARYLKQVLDRKVEYDPEKNIEVESIPIFRQSCGCLEAYSSRVVPGSSDQQAVWQTLIQQFDEYLRQGNEGRLVEQVYKVLSDELIRLGSLGMYQNLGQVFLSRVRQVKPRPEIEDGLPSVLLRVQMIHGALMSTSESIGKQTRSRSIWYLRHLIHEELTVLHPEQMYRQMASVLPELGIHGAAIAFYSGGLLNGLRQLPDIPPGIRWQFSYWNGQSIPLPPNGLEGQTNMLVPPGADVYSTSQPLILLFQALFHQYEHFGFIVFQVGKAEEVIYEGLRSQISGLIKAGRILETKESAARRLRESLQELESYNRSLVNLSIRDELTGLFNRRGFLELGEKLLIRASTLEEPVLLLFLDLDYLKRINDQHGHYQGDNALKDVAAAVKQSIRSQDVPARIGGDEFTILAPGMEEDQVEALKRRLLKALYEQELEHHRPYSLSISMGVRVCRPTSDVGLESLIADADMLMYKDKARRHSREESELS